MESNISIQENFLPQDKFVELGNTIFSTGFPWFFSPSVANNDLEGSPGFFLHMIYTNHAPVSPIYNTHFLPILEALNAAVLLKIQMNLNVRLPEPYFSPFHIDIQELTEVVPSTTSILYMNTNNGYTELEDGTIVESVANRLVSFPENIRHRVVTQTDEQTRYLINFNYLKHSGRT